MYKFIHNVVLLLSKVVVLPIVLFVSGCVTFIFAVAFPIVVIVYVALNDNAKTTKDDIVDFVCSYKDMIKALWRWY